MRVETERLYLYPISNDEMSNKSVAAKLFVYGREKNDVLIPTCGFGDYLYYAMWISGIHALSSYGISYAFVAFMVFAGTILQSITVKLSRHIK